MVDKCTRVAELAAMIEGLDSLWPSNPPEAALPNLDLLDTIHEVIALRCVWCVKMYEGIALEVRRVMRGRRDDDPNVIDPDEVSATYPAALNRRSIVIGIIGCGGVGRAVFEACLRSGYLPQHIMISTRQPDRVNDLARRGASVGFNNGRVAQMSDVVFLCCPPSASNMVANEMQSNLDPSSMVVSVWAGVSLGKVKQLMKSEASTRLQIDVAGVTVACEACPVDRDPDGLVRLRTPEIANFRASLALRVTEAHIDDVNALSDAVIAAMVGHNIGEPEMEAARTVGETQEAQHAAARLKCEQLFEKYWRYELAEMVGGEGIPSAKDVKATWNAVMNPTADDSKATVASKAAADAQASVASTAIGGL
eukprot:TRINITY_DN60570_c0_g1_i1.p1 TRINITY_DN60570_c0_g1~~TRINITY_DN60570_c0_g1_i1.p1  ORF type:complete len:366 (-),score=84.96 TRINITY_DN60570_c0_g1_i1:199-1296(-)